MTELANITIYNAVGQVVFQASDYSCRYGGSAALPGGVANGTLALPGMPTGDLWSMAMLYGITDKQRNNGSFVLDNANRQIGYRTDGLPASATVDLHYGLRPGGSVTPQADFVARLADDQGRVQFDSSWATMHLAQKGSVTLPQPGSGLTTTATVTYTGAQAPLIAFKPDPGLNVAVYADKSGATVTYTFCRYHIPQSADVTLSAEYWIYDKLPAGHQPDDITLALFDGGSPNQCLFDALRAPMRVAPQAAQPAGKAYAICPVFGARWEETIDIINDSLGNATGEFDIRTERGGWEFDSASGLYGTAQYQAHEDVALGYDGSFDPAQSMHLVLDVTNH